MPSRMPSQPPRPRAASGKLLPAGSTDQQVPLIVRFLKNVDPAIPRDALGIPDPAVCWTWLGPCLRRRSGPTGKFWYAGATHAAPRIALAIKTGELREADQACHTRDCLTGGLCVNFWHLYWGSQQDNIEDHVAVYGAWGRNKKYGRPRTEDGRAGTVDDHGRPDAGTASAGGADGEGTPSEHGAGTENGRPADPAWEDDDDPVPF